MPGWQSAAEAESSLLLCALTGAETGSGLGLVKSACCCTPRRSCLDADVYHRVRHEAARLDTSPEAIALEVIKEVGPRGHFLAHRHTRTHLRQRQFSAADRSAQPARWVSRPVEVARGKGGSGSWQIITHSLWKTPKKLN